MDKIKKQNYCQENYQSSQLIKENLIPIYFIEDNIKRNFTIIQSILNQHHQQIQFINKNIQEKDNKILQIHEILIKKIKQANNQTQNSIKQDLQGTVAMIVNKNLQIIMQKIQQKQQQQTDNEQALNKKLNLLQKKLSYEITQENQKYFSKEIIKIQKDIDKLVQSKLQKVNLSKNKQINPKSQLNSQQCSSYDMEEFKESLSVIKDKLQKIQSFNAILDKKFFDELNSLKQNWKQVGGELLQNKKILSKRFDSLNSQLIKLKTVSDFADMPQNMQESFKKQIITKFTQIQKIISTFTTRSQFESVNDRNRKIFNRYNDQLIQLRQQQSRNNEYFTLYMNNSDNDNLMEEIHKIKIDLIDDKKYYEMMILRLRNKDQINQRMIEELGKNVGALEVDDENMQKKIDTINQSIASLSQKIQVLQELSNIGPAKMKKIHQSLDKEFNFISAQIASSIPERSKNKQLFNEIQKLKDQIFHLNSNRNIQNIQKQDEINELRGQIKKLNQKIQKMKVQNEQGSLTRKPWICLSCDKQKMSQKIKQSLQKSTSKKKISIDIGKSGGFLTNRSEKNIGSKLGNNPSQDYDKFEVYEKFREKYLSDTLKLPQIFKQKIGSLQNQLM